MIISLKNSKIKDIIPLLDNSIFIYPTDTIYGIGCNASNPELVEKIRELKQRDNKPLSIIAPSKQWILDNCITTKQELDKYLPGPYTLILKKKIPEFLFPASSTLYLGVRIPKHDFTELLQRTNQPIITTSVNLSGQPFATRISEIPEQIIQGVDFIINAGTLSGNPSTIVKDGVEMKR